MNATILKNISLKPYNTLRLEVEAALMAFPHNERGIEELVNKYKNKKKIIVIGKGANVLLSKRHYDEDILFVNLKLMDCIHLSNGFLEAQCGATLSELSWFAIENSIEGFEFLEDIPGTLGGALIMNAGTYKDYIGNLVRKVKYFDFESNSIIEREITRNDFYRRGSYWANNKSIIISCTLSASKGELLNSLNKIIGTKKDRFLKQPRNYPNAGSVFIRPKKDLNDMVVWELLDNVGLRGFSKNGAAFSEKHPGFIINTGGARYEDIVYLIEIAQKRIQEKYNIELSVEWKIV